MISVLPAELIHLVLLFVLDTSRHSLFSVLLVNKALHDLTLPLLYRRLSLIFTDSEFSSLGSNSGSFNSVDQSISVSASERLARLLTDESYSFALHSIQELIISNIPRFISLDSQIWISVSTLISRLENLREMSFECDVPLPLVVLDALHQYHPNAHLHVFNWTRLRRDMPVGDPTEEALARSPCLRSISASLRSFRAGRLDLSEAAFSRIIGLAPNLTWVRAVPGATLLGGMVHDDRETEEREAERFLETNAPPNHVREVNWLSLSSVVALSRVLDLSAIESLESSVDWQQSPLHMGHTFSSLKHLCFTFSRIESLEILISTCNPLESLSIIDYDSKITLETIVLHHGSSLTSLGLHQPEVMSHQRPMLSLAELCYLRDGIPHLLSLEIDLNRTPSRDQEREVYEALASFPNLACVTLHFEVGWYARDRNPEEWVSEVYPSISEDLGKEVWRQVCGTEALHGLKRLTIIIKELYIGGAHHFHRSMADYEGEKLVVAPHERDDMVGEPQIVQFTIRGG